MKEAHGWVCAAGTGQECRCRHHPTHLASKRVFLPAQAFLLPRHRPRHRRQYLWCLRWNLGCTGQRRLRGRRRYIGRWRLGRCRERGHRQNLRRCPAPAAVVRITDDAAGRDSGDHSDAVLIQGIDGWYHTSKRCGASGCWAGELPVPPLPGDNGPGIPATSLPVILSAKKDSRR